MHNRYSQDHRFLLCHKKKLRFVSYRILNIMQMCICFSCNMTKLCFSIFPSKTGLVTTAWDRLFFFTQGGNLMCQPRGAVAGGMVLDLDNSSVMAVECEDRRYCFQITSPSGKTYAERTVLCVSALTIPNVHEWRRRFELFCSSMILQAESQKEYEEVSVNISVYYVQWFKY